MALTLYSLLEATLLLVNAVAILNRQRFLSKSSSYFIWKNGVALIAAAALIWIFSSVGLTQPTYDVYGEQQSSVKGQIVNLIYAVQTVMRG